VVHLTVPAGDTSGDTGAGRAVLAGFVVSKAVGGAVVRNTVTRRLRAVVRGRIDVLPAGSALVVRALPASATASSAELADELDACLAKLLGAGQPAGQL
jgi:ribonuclease P protein component